jgi:CrcB protein
VQTGLRPRRTYRSEAEALARKHWHASIEAQAFTPLRVAQTPEEDQPHSSIREVTFEHLLHTQHAKTRGGAPWRAATLLQFSHTLEGSIARTSHTSKLAHSHTHTPYTALSRYGVAELWKRTAVGKAHAYAATLTVNVVGSFILGCVAGGVQPGSDGVLLLGTGFCGAFTTFSTYAVDTVKLVEVGKYVPAVLYAVSSNFLCLGAALAGMRFTSSPPVAAAIGRFMSTHPPVGSLFAATSVSAGVPST